MLDRMARSMLVWTCVKSERRVTMLVVAAGVGLIGVEFVKRFIPERWYTTVDVGYFALLLVLVSR
jgi:hypothetical protein